MSCDDTSPCSRCHASEPDGASSAASDSSASPIWNSAFSAAFCSAKACSPAAALARDELVDAEDREPRTESLHQRPERGAAGLQLDHVGAAASLRESVVTSAYR